MMIHSSYRNSPYKTFAKGEAFSGKTRNVIRRTCHCHIQIGQITFLHCQFSEMAAAQGFLLVQEGTHDMCHYQKWLKVSDLDGGFSKWICKILGLKSQQSGCLTNLVKVGWSPQLYT